MITSIFGNLFLGLCAALLLAIQILAMSMVS